MVSCKASNGNQLKLTQTTYVGGFVYENNVLQFLSHEEGRVRMVQTMVGSTPTTNFVYDYFLKDHLGNVRTVLTDEQQTNTYPPASLETGTINSEKSYYTIPDGTGVRVNKSGFFPAMTPSKAFVRRSRVIAVCYTTFEILLRIT